MDPLSSVSAGNVPSDSIGIAVLDKVQDLAKVQAAQLIQNMKQTQASIHPYLGQHVDIRL